ncbi:hypothetical protein THAOC_08997 [Thalassiosira oceanica]|uniref:Uncharacterized protein n=1 Tax=Thalassiosira oceanica TaxID=159749 RepID=K0STP2_THAOC|nr:hypothetical protein THAOC_08997 [Thalassiosira oceanica]|eukprot:EJK69718.1 hypothetical protein THAOC_08997 [Thalassiosira oceanica]
MLTRAVESMLSAPAPTVSGGEETSSDCIYSLPPSAVSSVVSLQSLEQTVHRGVDTTNVVKAAVSNDEEEETEPETQLEALMNRGNYMRILRQLALADEEERRRQQAFDRSDSGEEKKEGDDIFDDGIRTLETGDRVLSYDTYLDHQRYHDDMKHVDVKYMDFGGLRNSSGEDCGRLVVEQCKACGKGGYVWDAGYILGDHVIAREDEWRGSVAASSRPRVLELGAGTGVVGLMLAKAVECDVVVTDLPELLGLMERNVRRNFSDLSDDGGAGLIAADGRAKGSIEARVLRWGDETHYAGAPYDVILGADIVTSIYDPVALAQTVHALSGPKTKVYISGKTRLDKPHEVFDGEMRRLFERVERVDSPLSRLKSPGCFIIVAEGRM